MAVSRRAKAVLALIEAKAQLDSAKKNAHYFTRRRQRYYDDNYDDKQRAYDAAQEKYEAAHAPTSVEVKNHLIEHLDTSVKVYVTEGPDVTVCVGLRWSDSGVIELFGQDESSDW